VALIGINMADPHYYDKVKDTPYFVPACLVVAGFLVANIFVMKALVNIKV
jgi:tight adherence protein B